MWFDDLSLKRKLIAAVALAMLATLLAAPARGAQDPTTVIKSLVDSALRILADGQTPLRQRQEQLRTLVSNNFEFRAMSRTALGYHWRALNNVQRDDFTQVFTAFIEDSYLNKIQDYSGQQVNFLAESYPSPDYAEVRTQIVQPGRQPIPVNYRLLQNDGKWLVYDVTVDNISIIANYRNQFNRVINDRGFGSLMADLKSKQQQLAARLGTPNSGQ